MKVSIITVVYNNKDFIRNCIDSVLSQRHKDIEYIIVDGLSTDGTIDIVKSYGTKISKFISEKDNGLYYAMNKGLMLATGDIIGFLNSDDIYADNDVVSDIVATITTKKVDALYGNLVFTPRNDTSQILRVWNSGEYNIGSFRRGWHPPHLTFYVRKYIYDNFGGFNTKYKIASDYELMLRFIEKNKISLAYLPRVLVKMRHGGASNKNLTRIIKANLECYNAWKVNDLKILPIIMFQKPIKKIKQLILPVINKLLGH